MGFPSPARDYIETDLDLNSFLVKHPASTYFLRVQGKNMERSGIFSGDILIVDRSLTPVDGNIIIADLEGKLLVRRILIRKGKIYLSTDIDNSIRRMSQSDDFTVWGVVSCVLHSTINNE